ncbi:DNA replication/repair protein RecF [Legionella oakridgensis]|uniref:DNA replication and repair protein RecF n=2 Tax=Legionella oakridgensis TaxID=29423 RepID=W0BAZ0_9GAMM|nr:DNA replication/repair protein RecF [Legionella oakridgensis]AHE65594.1 recF protein [Legionella oakridgensis ATCC 33761 = DSM 21215]KTD38370.1 RecF recombinational DNA repair ATPase [Legionella oakridgensis]STY15558.1 RecF recombinational DNA repair ATPase [Legionella longbeachae]
MILTELHVHHLRNIRFARLAFHPRMNVFYGANGSGKTSMLEAIYLLGTGHSFRTREISPLIQHEEKALTLFAKTHMDESISMQKSLAGSTIVKLNQQPCRNSSELARFLPCQVFYQDIFYIIDAGPSVRRNIMDWGLFHVKQSYHGVWKEYRRVLKQRNALLKQKANRQQFVPWDKLLVDLSHELDRMRSDYFAQWVEVFQHFLSGLTDISCKIHYEKGWDRRNQGKELQQILTEQFASDCQRQYTQSGAHQADFVFDCSSTIKAKYLLSRGQQKIILTALKLAQAHLLQKPCIYLFDDIFAELDETHLQRLLRCLEKIKGQFLFTVTDKNYVQRLETVGSMMVYSLEQGQIQCVSRETHAY